LATSLHLPGKDGKPLPKSFPFKYLDSATVPFVVVPRMIIRGVANVAMGCRAVVTNTKNNKSVEAVVGDGGPSNKLVEISLACAKAIDVPWMRVRSILPPAAGLTLARTLFSIGSFPMSQP
jgi:hypothetical protein